MFRIMFDELLLGDLNGRNIYDYSDEEMYEIEMEDDSNSYGPTKESSTLKPAVWRCKNGTTKLLSEMTDKHLNNSIAYCYRLNNVEDALLLEKEQERRKKAKLMNSVSQNVLCQFCNNQMFIKAVYKEPEREIGGHWGYTQFRLHCKCGAWGPIIKKVQGDVR